jgi:hypothetical protein
MRFSRKLAAATGMVLLAALALASVAPATSHHPTGEFEPFGECPLNRVTITDCIFGVTKGGSLTIGEKTISLVNPITLQGGYEGYEPIKFFAAENGDTLSKTPQPVPGGLTGITAPGSWPAPVQEWFNELVGTGFTGVTATIELAAPATSIALNLENLIIEEGTALGLPVKIKLSNAILGNNCYIGSNAEPIPLELTTGEGGELHGAVGELSFNEEFTLITVSGLKLVDGLFAAPEAEGCGGEAATYVDPLVDSIFGLPSGSEENSAILELTLEDANAEAVRNSSMW